jgi:ESCRT-II complex subunit VPS25
LSFSYVRPQAKVKLAAMTPSTVPTSSSPFTFPPTYSFPPFFSPQPNSQTRSAQLAKWSTLIQSYCRHHRLFKISLIDALDTPLFNNATLKRRLSPADATAIIDYMASKDGGERAEWIGPPGERASVWIWWRRPEEWANVLEAWVDETGQRGTVLTLYELMEGEATERQDFHGMDMEVMQKSLNTLVKRGKAQVFGGEGQEGVKFF